MADYAEEAAATLEEVNRTIGQLGQVSDEVYASIQLRQAAGSPVSLGGPTDPRKLIIESAKVRGELLMKKAAQLAALTTGAPDQSGKPGAARPGLIDATDQKLLELLGDAEQTSGPPPPQAPPQTGRRPPEYADVDAED